MTATRGTGGRPGAVIPVASGIPVVLHALCIQPYNRCEGAVHIRHSRCSFLGEHFEKQLRTACIHAWTWNGRANRANKTSGTLCVVHCELLTIAARKHACDRWDTWLAQLLRNVRDSHASFGCRRDQQPAVDVMAHDWVLKQLRRAGARGWRFAEHVRR